MKETFQHFVMLAALAGLAVSLGAMALRSDAVCRALANLLSMWRGLTAPGRFVAVTFLLVGILVGGDKTNNVPPNMNSPLSQMMQGGGLFPTGFSWLTGMTGLLGSGSPAPQTFAAKRAANWNIRGAWKDSFWLDFEDGWVFPHGSNHLSGVEVVSFGQVWPTPFDTNAVVSAGEPFEIVPGLTTFAYEFTPSNSYRFVWTDAAVGRDTNSLASAALELFRNGDVSVETNGVATFLPRELPFAHDGFGQDDEWVAANFTNATEILSVGYADWVDAQVGEGLTNGLYRLTVSVDSVPPETTCITVDDLSVAVTNAGDYVFLLEKGPSYDLTVFPPSDGVEISATDDVPALRSPPLLRVIVNGDDNDGIGEWTPDGGEFWTDYAAGMGHARFWWLPMLTGSPDVAHIGPSESQMTFSAILTDCRRTNDVAYSWSASEGLTVASPNSRTTGISIDDMPSWAQADISVTATFCGNPLTSHLAGLTYGTNDTPQVHLSLDAPDTVLVWTNLYANTMSGSLSLSLSMDCETNGTLCLECVQNAEKILLRDNVTGTIIPMPCQWLITTGFSRVFRVEGLSASENCDDVAFLASFVPAGGDAGVSESATLTVADVWHLAVSEEPKERCRTTLGVGESVIFYYRPHGMQIVSSSTSGEFLPSVDGMLPYYAPHTQDVSCVTLSLGSVTCSIPFTVVAPQDIIVDSIETNAYEVAGFAGIFEMTFHNRIVPTNVSFYAIETIEIPLVATNAIGYYAQPEKSDELDHGNRGGGEWGGVGYGNEYIDYVAAGYVAPPWNGGGSFTWPIPVAWRCRDDESVTNVFCHTDQRFELDFNGTVRVFKFGYCGERTTNNVFNITRIIQ